MEEIYVIKNSGEKELFSQQKVLDSMQRVGVPDSLRPDVLQRIKEKLHPDVKTSEIFSQILSSLEQKDEKSLLRFNLKQAIFELGPTGFPFEKYIAKVFEKMGYVAQVDVIMAGECVSHEIDILLEKDGKKEIVEAKFHNQAGVKTDLHVALYTYARFLDLKEKNGFSSAWLVTNTKLSQDAIKYCECKQIKSVAWNFPKAQNLQDMVEKPSLYPITILSSLTHEDKSKFLESGIILCSDLLNIQKEDAEGKYLVNQDRFEKAKKSAEILCGGIITPNQVN